MSDLSKSADDLLLRRTAYIADPMTNEDAESAEHTLNAHPEDMRLRSRLLLHYSGLWWGTTPKPEHVHKQRLRHVEWFISNVPDCKFCGERFFYLEPGEPNYIELKQLWLKKINESGQLMRRLNAFMLFANYQDISLPELFDEFFKNQLENPWVKAITEMHNAEQLWFREFIEVDSRKPMNPEETINHLTKQADENALVKKAASHIGATFDDFVRAKDLFFQSKDLEQLAVLLGYSWSRHKLFSLIPYDPEMAILRFQLACWVVRNIPGSQLAGSCYAFEPFFDVAATSYLSEPSSYLSSLWIDQFDRFPGDRQLAKNISQHARQIKVGIPQLSKKLSMKLKPNRKQ